MAVSRIPGVLILFLVLVSLSFSDAKLTRSLKLHLLDRHNKARQDARSPNMRRMEWSQPLAIIAEDTARSCSNEPASKNILSAAVGSKFSWVGENRQLISSAVQVNQSVLNQVLNCWLTGTADCQYKETNQVQILFPDTYLIGCGASYFSPEQRCRAIGTGVVVICFYAPGSIANVNTILKGEPCTKCPSDARLCVDGLCSHQNTSNGVPDDSSNKADQTVPYVWWITPSYGSYAGGTLLTLHGRGFSKDQFNKDNPNLGNRVTLYNDQSSIPCQVVTYYTSTTKIVCRTGPSPEKKDKEYKLKVLVDGKDVIKNLNGKLCNGNCKFWYRYWTTPTVTDVWPHAKVPDVDPMNITINGRIFSYLVSDTQEANEGFTITQTVDRLLIGGQQCNPWNNDTETPYGGVLTTSWGLGYISCRPETTRIDSMNATLVLSLYGNSHIPKEKLSVDNKLRQYIFQTHSDITRVEPNVGSPNGGTFITIYGIHFNDPLGDVKAFISGVPCDMVNYTATTIQCITRPAPPISSIYPGGRGIVREVWTKDYSSNLDRVDERPYGYPNTSFNWTVQERAYRDYQNPAEFGERTYFQQRYSGFFVPPIDSLYTFNFISDDRLRLYLSPNTSREHKELIAYANSHTRGKWNNFDTQFSRPIPLQGGKAYYIEAVQQQGWGPWSIGIGAKIHSLNWTNDRADADHEEQQVTTQSVVINETQEINITAKPKIQVITLGSEDNFTYYLSYLNSITPELTDSDNASVVTSALNNLPTVKSFGRVIVYINVTTDIDNELELSIIFISDQKNLGDFKVINQSNHTSFILQNFIQPSHFILSLSSRHTNSIPIHESTNNVTSELLTLFTTNCHITGAGNVYFKDGYDVIVQPTLYGTLDSSHEPYCGRYSLKNPTIVWRYDQTLNERSGQRVDPMTVSSIGYKYVCFAIYGTLPNSRLRIYGRINKQTKTYVYNIPVTDDSGTTKWRFLCVDVYTYLNERYNQQSNTYQVLRTYFYSSSTDFWVDEVMFTTSIPTVTHLERAVQPNGIFIDTVSVSSTSPTTDLICYDTEDPLSCNLIVSRYVVEFKVHHCGYNMPLLSSSPNNVLVSRLYSGTPPVNGTFQLTFENQTVYNIPANALASELKTLLKTYLPNEGGFEVSRSGDCSGYMWSIKWTGRGGDLPLMSANGSGLSGNMVNISVAPSVDGGVWLRPFRGDMLRLPELEPQVEVLINGIPASCRNQNCSFKFSPEVTPQIMSISPFIGGQDSTPITIYGTGFTDDINNVTVTIGDSSCNITFLNDTVISCVPTPNVAGPQNVSVHVDGVGYSISSTPNSSIFQYSLIVNSIQPDKGSISGGNLVTITGVGFPTLSNITKPPNLPFYFSRDFYVVFDDFPCIIISSNLTVLTCTPQPHGSDVVNVTVVVNGVTAIIDSGYEYTENYSATITSISPLTGPVYGGTELTINGKNFNLTNISDIVITIGQASCLITSFSATEINCTTSPHYPGVYNVSVHSTIFGVAFNESQTNVIDQQSISLMEILNQSSIKMFNTTSAFMLPVFTYQLIVTKLTPCSGSLLGGTKISINGTGFGSNVTVTTGLGIECNITTVTYENIECVTSSTRKEHFIDNSAKHAILGRYFAWNPANIKILPGDKVTWKWTSGNLTVRRKFEVHQTASPSTSNYVNGGFQSAANFEGIFSYTFTQPGVYYFASYVDDVCQSCLMSGSITVRELEDIATAVIVKVDGFESLYHLDYHNDTDLSSGSGQTECLSCQNLTNSLEPKSSPIFVYSNCNTPVVKWINDHISTLYSNISLSGYDFGLDPSNAIIKFGDYSCTPLVYSDSLITCRLNMTSQPTPFNFLPLSLHIYNSGFAFLNSEAIVHKAIVITPVITSISPLTGSVLGGNIITITGASFVEKNLTVYIGTERCTIKQVSYYQIQCIVPRSVNISMPHSTVPVNVSYGPKWEVICESSDGCDYQYSLNATPTIFAVDPIIVGGVDVQTITISGELLDPNSTVMVGPFKCVNITSIDFENITCQLSPIQAGKYLVSVLVPTYGFAQFSEETDNSITSLLRIDGISPLLGSIRGGTKLTISGIGFSDNLSNNSVSIGSSFCQIVESRYTSLSCSTPDLGKEGNYTVAVSVTPAPSSQQMRKRDVDGNGDGILILQYSKDVTPQIMGIDPLSGQQGDVVIISGRGFTSNISLVSVSFGSSKCNVSFTNDTIIICTLGPNYVGSYQVEVVIFNKGKADGNLTFMYILQIDNVSPTNGSFAGQSVLTILGVGFNPVSTFITVCNQTCLPSFTQPSLTSIQCIIPSFSHLLENSPTLTSQVCDVTVTSLSSSVSLPQAYTLLADLTPNVTSINRTRGGTAGGSIIELIGSGFSDNVTVTIAGVDCSVLDKTQSTIVCQTGASGRTIKAPVMVYVEGKGYAISNNIEFYYVDLWSSKYTWGGLGLPKEGDFVIVPAGQTLVLDISTPVLKILLIQGGELIFDDKKDGVQLHSEHILITDGGKLQVGTEDQPYQHKAQIVMYGHVLSTELPLFGAKTLAVRNGTLDLHGKPITNTWTWLSTTAYAGNTTLYLKNTVADWEVGGKVVIASTSYSQRENEELTIVSIGADKMSITVKPPLQYTHIAVTQVIHGRVIETRAEVGYLTRNVVVRGNKNSEWNESFDNCPTDFDPGQFAVQTCFNGRFGAETIDDQFGSQIMLHRGPRDKVIGRIEYIEVTHAGQAFRLGRYPIHFHLNGDVSDSYVRGCGIHHTFNRAVTIHGVDYLLVEKNVAYNILGHAYFLEDGIEQGNIIQYNLGIFVRASSSLLNVDITPATFWVVNPNNTLRHNAAAGGTHFGFWYRLPANPTGPSFTTAVKPLHLPLAKFTNNSAHSFGWYGIWIFPSYHPEKASTCDEVTPAVFEKFLAWRNVRGVEFSEVGAVQLKDSVMLDNTVAGVEYTKVTAAWGKNGSLIEDVLIVAHSDLRNIDNVGTKVCTGAGIKTPHSYYLTVSNITFVNFNESSCYTLQACSHCRAKQGGFETRFEKLVFDNSPNIATWKWKHEQVFRDMDGTLTGNVGGALLPTSTILPSPHCSDHSASSFGAVRGSVCDDKVHFARFALTNPTPSSLTTRNLNVTSQHGILQLEYVFKRLLLGPGYMALLPIKEIYQLDWDEGERFNNISYSSLYSGITTSDYLWIRHDFNKSVDYIKINKQEKNASLVIPPGGLSQLGDWYVNNNETSVTYYVNGSNPTCPSNVPVSFTSYRCLYKNCIPPPPPKPPTPLPPGRPNATNLWSDQSIWPNELLPQNDTDVYINCSLYILVDVPLPRIKTLSICGGLEFLDERDHILEANLILIDSGRLVAGSEDKPFQHQLTIILNGDLNSPEYRLPNLGLVLGAKGIGVFGQLSLHGKDRSPTWTFLAQTAKEGDTQVVLSQAVDWQIGEEIVIASTFYEVGQTEERTITNISNDGLTLSLNSPLIYNHLGGVHNTNSCSVNISAEVGLLSRNIKILGTHPNATVDVADRQSYGCRVLVGTYFVDISGTIQYTGSAQLEGVEFKGCGQEGFVETFDPRYSLAFLNIGQVKDNSSYVKSCSFHKGYNTGIGVFGTKGMSITNNVVHRTIGPSLYITGSDHQLIQNLAVVALFPGTYNGRNEPWNAEWTANYELAKASNYVLIGNSAAGGAKAGYHTNGENCISSNFSPTWKNNIAHTTLHGIHVGYSDGHFAGDGGCSSFHDFTIYSCYHYGLFSYSKAGVLVTESTFVNNYAAIFTAVIGPAALSHRVSTKTVIIKDSEIISSINSGSINCTEYSFKPAIGYHARSHSGIQSPWKGHVGVILSSFTSGSGHFPKFPWSGTPNYPAIKGLTKLSNVSFCNFGTHCSSMKEVVLMTHPTSEDCQHPVWTKGITFLSVNKASKFFNHKPILGSVNPSDCVDMDCDALKKILIRDLDGSFTGSTGLNSLISKSEFEWDGDRRRGLGDYRIPKTMLATPTGSKIDPDVLYPYKGIYGVNASDCQWEAEWNSYHCTNIDHMMFVIESLDADTEVRRLSPIGVGANGYIDLINGPQDHGWCGGYTCQERISTFYAIVSTGLNYTIAMTSTNPQKTNLYLLNADDSQGLVIAIIYTNPQRLDVYVGTEYIIPTNGYMKDGNLRYKRGDNFIPTLSDSHGTNYYDRNTKRLHIVIKGDTPVRIETTQVIQLGIDLPPVTVNEFFEVNLIQNLALLLGITPNRIRIVNVISESGGRKRETSRTRVEFEIGAAPSNDTTTPNVNGTDGSYNNQTGSTPQDDTVYKDLLNVTTRVGEVIQTGELSKEIGYDILDAVIIKPQPVRTDPTQGVRATNVTGGPQPGDNGTTNLTTFYDKQLQKEEKEDNDTNLLTISIPTRLGIINFPSEGVEGILLISPIKVAMYDGAGLVVSTLGVGLPWQLTVSPISKPTGAFLMNSTGNMGNGIAQFSDLLFSYPGRYRLQFDITYPLTANFSLTSSSSVINIQVRQLYLQVISQPPSVTNTTFPFSSTVTVHIMDTNTNAIVTNLQWRGQQWFMTAAIILISTGQRYGQDITVNIEQGVAQFQDIHVKSAGSYKIQFSVFTNPASSSNQLPQPIDSNTFVVKKFPFTRYIVTYNNSYNDIVRNYEEEFKTALIARIQESYPAVLVYNVSVYEGSIIATFFVTSSSTNGLNNIATDTNLFSFSFRGRALDLSSIQQDPAYPITQPTEPPIASTDVTKLILGIVCGILGLLVVILLIIVAVAIVCYYTNKRKIVKAQHIKVKPVEDTEQPPPPYTLYPNLSALTESEEDYPLFQLITHESEKESTSGRDSRPASQASSRSFSSGILRRRQQNEVEYVNKTETKSSLVDGQSDDKTSTNSQKIYHGELNNHPVIHPDTVPHPLVTDHPHSSSSLSSDTTTITLPSAPLPPINPVFRTNTRPVLPPISQNNNTSYNLNQALPPLTFPQEK